MTDLTPLQEQAVEYLADLIGADPDLDVTHLEASEFAEMAWDEAQDLIGDGIRQADDARTIAYLMDLHEGLQEIGLEWDTIVVRAIVTAGQETNEP